MDSTSTTSTDIKLRDLQASMDEPVSPGANIDTEPLSKQMSFFDVGGLVDAPKTKLSDRPPLNPSASAPSPGPGQPRGRTGSKAFLTDIGGLLGRHKEEDESGTRTPLSSRSLTPSRLKERRKASRSPNPARRLREAEGMGSGSGTGSAKGSERSPVIRPTDQGPDSLTFGDIGGLLR